VRQRLVAPKTWLGSEEVNVLQILCDLLELVQQMNIQLASHAHSPGSPPIQADIAEFLVKASATEVLHKTLGDLTSP